MRAHLDRSYFPTALGSPGVARLTCELLAAKKSAGAARWRYRIAQPQKTLQIAVRKYSGTTQKVIARLFTGDEFRCVLPEHVSKFLYRFGYFEYDLTRAILRLLKEGQTFIDVGAHLGYFSVVASRLVGSNGRVVALEPTPRTRSVTLENLDGRANVQVLPLAAWHEERLLDLSDFGWVLSALNSTYGAHRDAPAAATVVSVQGRPLDSIADEMRLVPDFIKVDAEGAELNVLRGAKEILLRHSPILSIEVGDYREAGGSSRSVLDFASSLGYRPYEIAENDIRPHAMQARYEYTNLLLVKSPAALVGLGYKA